MTYTVKNSSEKSLLDKVRDCAVYLAAPIIMSMASSPIQAKTTPQRTTIQNLRHKKIEREVTGLNRLSKEFIEKSSYQGIKGYYTAKKERIKSILENPIYHKKEYRPKLEGLIETWNLYMNKWATKCQKVKGKPEKVEKTYFHLVNKENSLTSAEEATKIRKTTMLGEKKTTTYTILETKQKTPILEHKIATSNTSMSKGQEIYNDLFTNYMNNYTPQEAKIGLQAIKTLKRKNYEDLTEKQKKGLTVMEKGFKLTTKQESKWQTMPGKKITSTLEAKAREFFSYTYESKQGTKSWYADSGGILNHSMNELSQNQILNGNLETLEKWIQWFPKYIQSDSKLIRHSNWNEAKIEFSKPEYKKLSDQEAEKIIDFLLSLIRSGKRHAMITTRNLTIGSSVAIIGGALIKKRNDRRDRRRPPVIINNAPYGGGPAAGGQGPGIE